MGVGHAVQGVPPGLLGGGEHRTPDHAPEDPARQRRAPPKPLPVYAARKDRDAAIAEAYASGGYSMKEIGDHFGLHYSYVSRIVRRVETARRKT